MSNQVASPALLAYMERQRADTERRERQRRMRPRTGQVGKREKCEQQSGVCAVEGCGAPVAETGRLSHADHDHGCPAGHPQTMMCDLCQRGILCPSCNRAIGFIGDSPERAAGMALYLTEWAERLAAARQEVGLA